MKNIISKDDYEGWVRNLHLMARKWHETMNLDEEDCFSELLVAYATALETFNPKKNASFGAWFFFHRQHALRNLKAQADRDESIAADSTVVFDGSSEEDDYTLSLMDTIPANSDAFRLVMMKLDARQMGEDVATVLDFLLEKGIRNTGKNIGKSTVVREIREAYGWSKHRSVVATEQLSHLHMEYCLA